MPKVIKIGEDKYSNVNTILVPSGEEGATENDVVAFGGTMLSIGSKEYDNLDISNFTLMPSYSPMAATADKEGTTVEITGNSTVKFKSMQGTSENPVDSTIKIIETRDIELPISGTSEIEPSITTDNKLGFKLSDSYKADLTNGLCKQMAMNIGNNTSGSFDSATVSGLLRDNYTHILVDGKDIYRLEKRGRHASNEGENSNKNYAVYSNVSSEGYSFIEFTFEESGAANWKLEKTKFPVFTLNGTTLRITTEEEII